MISGLNRVGYCFSLIYQLIFLIFIFMILAYVAQIMKADKLILVGQRFALAAQLLAWGTM